MTDDDAPWHAHIYFKPDERPGSHPTPQYEIRFLKKGFAQRFGHH